MKRLQSVHRVAAFVLASSLLAACGGGGGGGGITPGGGSTPTPTPVATPCPAGYTGTAPNCTATTSGSTAFTLSSTAATNVTLPPVSGYTGSATIPQGTASSNGTLADSLTTQNGTPLQGTLKRSPQAASGLVLTQAQTNTALLYLSVIVSASETFTSTPGFSISMPSASSGPFYIAMYSGGQWQTLEQGTVSGSTVTFASVSGVFSVTGGTAVCFALYTGGPIATPTPTPTATPSPTPTATPSPTPTASGSSSLACATGAGATAIARSYSQEVSTQRRSQNVTPGASIYEPNALAVSYASSFAKGSASAIVAREGEIGRTVGTLHFDLAGKVTHIVTVPSGDVDAAAATLRTQPGVESVSRIQKRYSQEVSHVYFTNDPYYEGFGQPPTLYESASTPGQWDMQVIGLRCAMAYSQPSDVPSGVTANANALGSPSVKIAIIDTGEDTTHPELASKIVYQKSIVNGVTSNSTNDPDGHGTDVSGIAAAAANNGVGFIGDGGNVSIMGYRVFPTPTSACDTPGSSDPSCSASTADIAAAINDAVANGASVISMSLGGGGCTGGVDSDPTENAAIVNAIAHNVIVVAAAGNSGTNSIDAPGCATGVIAVGASSLDDGQPNGKGTAIGSAANPVEYVASYSEYGTPGVIAKSSAAWGIVAPGGDPSGDGDSDDLHWIENIWTSTPYDTKDDGTCTPDYQATNGIVDCRTLIAGTSMATPHVAGAVALILSVNSSYKSPAAMKALLCSTADDINDSKEGCGRLNVYRAMATAMGDPHLP